MGTVNDLRGRTFGRLTIPTTAEPLFRAGDAHAYWPCVCECGERAEVRGSKLASGAIVSCGCYRASKDVRQAARMTVPERRRRAIARKGGKAFAANLKGKR